MFEPNATLITARIQEACRYQVLQVIKNKGAELIDYSEAQKADPGEAVMGRFEITIPDHSDVDPEKLAKATLRAATGLATLNVVRVHYADNGWIDPERGTHGAH